jgi:hypothetical protein
MQGIEDYKQSLISIGYSEEMAQRIAEGLVKALQPTNREGDK